MDAPPPPPPVRTCMNGDVTFDGTTEHLTLKIVCQSPADAVPAHALVTGGSGSNVPPPKFVDFTITCNPTLGLPANNFLVFPDTQVQSTSKVSAALFDIDCT
jgi:hypothetical protein